MNIRHIFMTIAAIMLASAVFADSSSVTSKKYVDDFMAGYQNKIPGSGADKLMIYDDTDGISAKQIVSSLGDDTSATNIPDVGAVKDALDDKQDKFNGTEGYVMTGMGTNRPGEVGERAIYSTSLYGDSLVTPETLSSALVTAETVNSGVINAVNNSLRRVNENGELDNNGTLWEIQDDLTALSICSDYTPATGTGVQNGTPTPTNPIMPNFYEQGNMILRAVGTYADSYDANTNKITRRVGVFVFDGNTTFNGSTEVGTGGYIRYAVTLSDKLIGYDVLSNAFVTSSTTPGANETSAKISGHNTTSNIYFTFPAALLTGELDTGGKRTIAMNNWFADQYAAGTPVVVYYPLATPVTEDMPQRCQ